jgi:lipopolysaccharide export system permease protein
VIRRSANPAPPRHAGTLTLVDRYVETETVNVLALVSAGLTSLFSLLEFVEQLHDVGTGQYHMSDALLYVLLTVPGRLLQLTPVSMLLATLFALGSLASHNELTVMRATGIPPRRIVGSVFKLAALVLLTLFLLAEYVIPGAEQLAQSVRLSRLSSASTPFRSENGFWANADLQYLNVRRFEHGNVPKDIYVYTFAADGELQSLIHADSAQVRRDGNWLLIGVLIQRFTGTGIDTEREAEFAWHSFLRPQQVRLLILPPDSMPPVALYQYVRDLERRHQPAELYAQTLWAKIDIPLAMAAMILIAVPFVFGPLRTHGTGQRIMVGAMIGIVFSLVQQTASYLGLLYALSPALTATLPSLALMAVALYLVRRAFV